MRLATWDQNLMEYIEQKRNEPFAWGTHDCLTFISGAVEAMVGEDLFADEIYKYKDYKTGLSAYKRYKKAGKSYQTTLNRVLTPFEGRLAPRGSVVANIEIGGAAEVLGAALGIVVSDRAVYVGDDGLIFQRVSAETKSWLV